MRDKIRNLLLLFVTIIVCLLLSELFIYFFVPVSRHYWVFNEDFHHLFIKNLDVSLRSKYTDYSVGLRTDSRGFRSEEFSYVKDKNAGRVIVLGDSTTAGVGVPADKLYTSVLSQMLNNGSSVRWEVINRGIEDWGTDHEYLYFVNEGYKYNADVVVLQFLYNDFTNVWGDNITSLVNGSPVMQYKFPKPFVLRRLLFPLNGYSGIYRLFAEFYEANFRTTANMSSWFSMNHNSADFNDAFTKTSALIKSLDGIARGNGAVLVVFVASEPRLVNQEHYDFWNNIYQNYVSRQELNKPILMLKEFLRRNNIIYVDASDYINATNDFIAFNDGHMSISGHKKAAGLLYKNILKLEKKNGFK